MTETLAIDDLIFVIRRSSQRSTVSIIVDRDSSLAIAAPEKCPIEFIERFIRSRQIWIYRKLAEKRFVNHQPVVKSFVDGEGFPYLGRSYRLQLVDPAPLYSDDLIPPVRLFQRRFQLRRDILPQASEHFINWYGANCRLFVNKCVGSYAERVGVTPRRITIQDLGYRWGSCSKDNTLNFHWRAVLLPPQSIEYVVLHELVHLAEPRHDQAFWRKVRQAMPDYEDRKQWLACEGGQFNILLRAG